MSYDKKSHDNIAAEHPEFCSSFISRSHVLLSGPLPGIAMTHGETSKGICAHCKKQVVVYPGQAWHGKDDKVWHELCSYQAEIGRLAAAFESLKELRAKELAEQLVVFAHEHDDDSGGEWFSVYKATPILAAALAACAREVLREVNAEAEADMLKGNPITGAHHRAIERKLLALERAAGEKAT